MSLLMFLVFTPVAQILLIKKIPLTILLYLCNIVILLID